MSKACLTEIDHPYSKFVAKSCYTQDTLSPRSPFGPKAKTRFIFPKNFDSLSVDSEVLDNYYFWSDIGKGTFATVRLATEKLSGTQVAIKIYEKSKLRDIIRQQSVKNEIYILHKLSHPNILTLHKEIRSVQNLYLVMEYIKGISLNILISQPSWKKLNESQCAKIFTQIMQALSYCHSQNVAHRDIKLENIILSQSGHIKLIDFGFATISPHKYKQSYLYCGTPNYMAPEIVRRERYPGEPADVWAAGILLFMMLCGRFPFGSSKELYIFEKILKHDIVYPEGISVKCRNLLVAMLEPCWVKRISADGVLRHPWIVERGLGKRKNLPHNGDVDEVLVEM